MSSGGLDAEILAIREKVAALIAANTASAMAGRRRKALDGQIRDLIADLEQSLARIDPVAMPSMVFDPSNPKIIGRFTALALVAQPPRPLASLGRFYGSGVYAVYYTGAFPVYRPVSGSETPIYVGKAGPALQGARDARDQGERLAARLNDHRKNIRKAASSLNLEDFSARFLVVQSGWETAAEDYLIHLFKPVWNSETDILYGLGKHGDAAETRANKRSPWDSLHPGRAWAEASKEDARSIARIETDLAAHFLAHRRIESHSSLAHGERDSRCSLAHGELDDFVFSGSQCQRGLDRKKFSR